MRLQKTRIDRKWISFFTAFAFSMLLVGCGGGGGTANDIGAATDTTVSGVVQGAVTLDAGASAASLAHAAGVGDPITVAVYDQNGTLLGGATADASGKYAIPVTVDNTFQEGDEGVRTLRVVATSNGRTLSNYVLANDIPAWGSVYLSPEIEAYSWYRDTLGGASAEDLAVFAKDNTSNGSVVSPVYQPLAQKIAPDVSSHIKSGVARPDVSILFGYARQLLQSDLLAKDSSGISTQRTVVSGERFAATFSGSLQPAQSTCGITEVESGIFTSSPSASGNCLMVFKMGQRFIVLQQPMAQPVTTSVLAQTVNPQDGASAQAGSITVDIPAYALAAATPFSVNAITSEGTSDLGKPVLQMTGGVEFNLPVRVGVRYADLGIADPRTAVWRTNGSTEPIFPVAVENGIAYFELLNTRTTGTAGASAQSLARARAAAITIDFKLYVVSKGYIKPLYPIALPSTWSGTTPANRSTVHGAQYFHDWSKKSHAGNDLAVGLSAVGISNRDSLNQKVYPICPGKVLEINSTAPKAVTDRRIVIEHDPGCGGYTDLVGNYMHLNADADLKVHQRVNRDTPLGSIEQYPGSTTNNHLHFTLYQKSMRPDRIPDYQVTKSFNACIENIAATVIINYARGTTGSIDIPTVTQLGEIGTEIACADAQPSRVINYNVGYGNAVMWDQSLGNTVRGQYNLTHDVFNWLGMVDFFDIYTESDSIHENGTDDSLIVNLTTSLAGQNMDFGSANFRAEDQIDQKVHQLYMTGVTTPDTCQLIDNAYRFGPASSIVNDAVKKEGTQGVLRVDSSKSVTIGGVSYYRLYIDSTNAGTGVNAALRKAINGLPDLRISSGYKISKLTPTDNSCGDISRAKLFVSPVTAAIPARLVTYSKSVLDASSDQSLASSTFRFGALHYTSSGSTTNSIPPCTKIGGTGVDKDKCLGFSTAVSGNYVDAAVGSKSVFALSLAGQHQLFVHLMEKGSQTLAQMNDKVSIKLVTVSNGAIAETIDLKIAEDESTAAASKPIDYQDWYFLQRSPVVSGQDGFNFDLKGQAYIVIEAKQAIKLDAIRAVSPVAATRANVSRGQTVILAASAANASPANQAITATVQVKTNGFWSRFSQSMWNPFYIPLAQSTAGSTYQYNAKFDNLEEGQYRVIYSAHPTLNLQPVVFEFDIAANGEATADLPAIHLGDKGRSDAAVDVISSTTNQPVAGATVKFYYGYTQNVANSSSIQLVGQGVTDASGRVSLTSLVNGLYTVVVEKAGNTTSRSEMQVGRDTSVRRFISPVLSGNQARAVLRWGQNPRDLDSHLIRYTGTAQDYHIYYSSRLGADANLDVDVTSGFGPETVSFTSVAAANTYKYVIHNYSGAASGSIAASGAAVSLTFGSTTREFFPPNEAGIWWHVFDIVNGVVVPCQTACMAADINTALRSGSASAASSRAVNAFVLPPKR